MEKNFKDSCLNQTYFSLGNYEDNEKKSYYMYWRRAMSKIKINFLLQRFEKIEKNRKVSLDYNLSQQDSPQIKQEQVINQVILPYNLFYIGWLFLVLVSIVYITFFATFYTSFYGDEYSDIALIVEILVDIIFVIDLVLNFNLAYYEDKNLLIKDRKKIALQYLKFSFWIDFLIILPFLGIFSHNRSLLMFRHQIKVLKWITFKEKLQYFQYIKKIDYSYINHKSLFNSIILSIICGAFFHVFACLFYLTARYEEFSSDSWVVRSNIQNDSVSSKYVTTLYWSLTTVASIGYGDIHPYTEIEIFVSMIWMCTGVFTISYSVSKATVIINKIKKKEQLMDNNLQIVEDFSKKAKISKTLQYKLKQTIRKQKIVTYRFQILKIIESLDSNLRYQVAADIYGKAVKKIPFFSNKTEEFIGVFVFRMEFVQVHQEKYLWRKNSFSDGIYFIISGRVKYFCDEMMFFVFSDGGFFGDTEVFLKTERKFDVLAADLCKFFKVSKESLKILKAQYLKYYIELKNMSNARLDNLINGLAQMKVIYKLRDYKNFSINREYVEKLKTELMLSVFNIDFLTFGNEKFEEFLNDLKYFTWILRKIKAKMVSLLGNSQYVKSKD